MKNNFFGLEPNVITIIDRTREAAINYIENNHSHYGFDYMKLKQEHLDALKQGKVLAINNEEYTCFIELEEIL